MEVVLLRARTMLSFPSIVHHGPAASVDLGDVQFVSVLQIRRRLLVAKPFKL